MNRLLLTAPRPTESPLPTPSSKTDSPNNTNRNSSSSHGEACSVINFWSRNSDQKKNEDFDSIMHT